MEKAKPNVGEDGRMWADPDGGWYYLTEILEDGSEKRITSSNSLFHVQESATRFSVGKPGFSAITLGNILLVDGKTHRAIAFYAKEEGQKKEWREEDKRKASQRKKAWQKGTSKIDHE